MFFRTHQKICFALSIPVVAMVILCLFSLSYSSFVSLINLDTFLRQQHTEKELEHISRDIMILKNHFLSNIQNQHRDFNSLYNFYDDYIQEQIGYNQQTVHKSLNAQEVEEFGIKYFYDINELTENNVNKREQYKEKWGYYSQNGSSFKQIFTNPDSRQYLLEHLEVLLQYLQIIKEKNDLIKNAEYNDDYIYNPDQVFIISFRFEQDHQTDNIQLSQDNIFTVFYPFPEDKTFETFKEDVKAIQNTQLGTQNNNQENVVCRGQEEKFQIDQYKKFLSEKNLGNEYFFQQICFFESETSLEFVTQIDNYQYNKDENIHENDFLSTGFANTLYNKDEKTEVIIMSMGFNMQEWIELLEQKYAPQKTSEEDTDSSKIPEDIIMFFNDQKQTSVLLIQHEENGTSDNQGSESSKNSDEEYHSLTQEYFSSYTKKLFQKDDSKKKLFEKDLESYQQKIIKDVQNANKNEKTVDFQVKNIGFKIEETDYHMHIVPIVYKTFSYNLENGQNEYRALYKFWGNIAIIISEQTLQEPFLPTFQRLDYIKYITFSVIFLLSLFILFMAVRNSWRLSNGVFQLPLENVKKSLERIDNDDSDYLDYDNFQTNFTCEEIQTLIQSIISLVNDIKFSNQLFTENDATTLLRLSKAKLRYNHNENLSGVGICCNNIGNIHLKNGRFSEAVSEYQESILMAKIEYKEKNKEIQRDYIQKSDLKEQYKQLKEQKQKNNNEKSGSQNSLLNNHIRNLKNSNKDNNNTQQNQNNNNNINFDFNQQQYIENNNFNNSFDENDQQSDNYDENQNYYQGIKIIGKNYQAEYILDLDLSARFQECEQLIQKRNHAKLNMLNRKYQLGVALFYYAAKEKDVNFLPQAVELFKQCIKISETQLETRSNLARRILILQKQSYCNIKLLELTEAQNNIKLARSDFEKLKSLDNTDAQYYQQPQNRVNRDFIDIFDNIPDQVIESQILYVEAIIELANFNFQKAASILTEIIYDAEQYDTFIREQTLELLQTIFTECLEKNKAITPDQQQAQNVNNNNTDNINNNKNSSNNNNNEQQKVDGSNGNNKDEDKDKEKEKEQKNITNCLQKFKLDSIDIIFLIDYSKQMQEDQIQKSHQISKNIFDKLQPNDNLGFLVFNDSVHECFQIQNKKKYQDLLEKKVRTIMLVPGGRSNLNKALIEGTTFFDKQDGIKMEQEEQKIENGEKIRYLVLFTEGDYTLKESEKLFIQKLFVKKKIHLLVSNISHQNQNMLNLQKLTQLTEQSSFFPGEDELPEFIAHLRERSTKQQLVYEYLS